MNTCIDCGEEYHYSSKNAKGASADRCSPCRKRQTILNKRIHLLNIAGAGNPMCRKCGYRNPVALVLIDGLARLTKQDTDEFREENAKTQFVLCYNCESELQHRLIEVKVTDTSKTPIKLEIYECKVTVVKTPIKSQFEYSDDAQEFEISNGGEDAAPGRKKEVLRIGSTIDVS